MKDQPTSVVHATPRNWPDYLKIIKQECLKELHSSNSIRLVVPTENGTFQDNASKLFKTDSAQSSSNKCKNYLLKNCSQHINLLNTILNISLWFISLGDPAMKSPSIPDTFNDEPHKNISCVCYCVFN